MITIEGNLTRIRFHNRDTLYTVAELKTTGQGTSVTLTGIMPSATPGQSVRVKGDWHNHPRYGRQFKINSCEVMLPASAGGIKRYLKSGLIRGIGPAMADRITSHLGEATLDIIENEPERLTEVPGIGDSKAALIREAWLEHRTVRELMDLLQEKGVDAGYSARIFRLYGPAAINIIKDDPFQLAEDLPGAGFRIADTIALSSGRDPNSPGRVQACLRHLVNGNTNTGNVFIFEEQLLGKCESLFQIDRAEASAGLSDLIRSGCLVSESMPGDDPDVNIIYPAALHEAETGAAARIQALLTAPVFFESDGPDEIMAEVVRQLAIKPSPEQLRVLEEIFYHRVVVVTGGPGTGKTTLIRSIAAVLESSGKKLLLAAPTGRASKRLAEVSGRETGTIHKLLGYNFQDDVFAKNRDNQLRTDAVIVDEASMVDLPLFYNLLLATPVTSTLILVGDVFQLPPVGPGNVLNDLIRSDILPVFHLSEIFRQARQSAIVTNAHQIRRGEAPDLNPVELPGTRAEFCFMEEEDTETLAGKIVTLCRDHLPGQFGLDPLTEIQVLTPMHKGAVGTLNLNQKLQAALNPASPETAAGGGFRANDKVMHLRNNYGKEVFNGDIGTIAEVDGGQHALTVDYGGRLVEYDLSETDQLSLAYAITVHKAQGSEYPAVVIPMTTRHYPLLQRNLLYTAITRARRLVVLIGTTKAINVAMKRDLPSDRLSLLAYRLNPDLLSRIFHDIF
ncbi:MAG: ATP-dependent RecD-like DNA helicase [Desulfosudaceae bacterium]